MNSILECARSGFPWWPSYLAYDSGGDTHRQAVRRDGLGNNAAGPDDAVRADYHARQNHDTAANPDIIADAYRLDWPNTGASFTRLDFMKIAVHYPHHLSD